MGAVTKVGAAANVLAPTNLDEAIRLADWMASADVVPDHLKGKAGNCLLIVEQAINWRMSPYAVAQCSFVYKGRLGYEGKLVHAAVETADVLDGDGFIDEYEGEGENLTLKLTATIKGQSRPRTLKFVWKDCYSTDKNGNVNTQWLKSPEQMLFYYGTRAWTRRYKPSVLLGVYTYQELSDPKRIDTDDAPIIEGSAVEQADAAIKEVERRLQAQQQASTTEVTPEDGEKVVKKPYRIISPDFDRSHETAEHWLQDWRTALAPYVKRRMVDRIHALHEMNKGALTSVSEFDFDAHTKAKQVMADALKAIRDAFEADATKEKQQAAPGASQHAQNGGHPIDQSGDPGAQEEGASTAGPDMNADRGEQQGATAGGPNETAVDAGTSSESEVKDDKRLKSEAWQKGFLGLVTNDTKAEVVLDYLSRPNTQRWIVFLADNHRDLYRGVIRACLQPNVYRIIEGMRTIHPEFYDRIVAAQQAELAAAGA